VADRAEEVGGLLAAARAGSREALGRVLEGCRRYLLGVAEGELGQDLRSKGGASDIVQETFLEAGRNFAGFQGSTPEELRAWLRQVLLYKVGAFRRRYRGTGKRELGREIDVVGDSSWGGIGQAPAGSTLTPSGALIEHERALALRRALDRLPEEYRRVVVLRFEEERSFEEIGRLTERSAEAARKVWSRAMERMREDWERQT
jgi:RNA polymerase sigma-70 factor (ECF subfamily)